MTVQYMVTNGHHTSCICHHAVGLLFHILPLTSHYNSKGLSLTKYDGERWFLMMMFNFRLKCKKKSDFLSLPYQVISLIWWIMLSFYSEMPYILNFSLIVSLKSIDWHLFYQNFMQTGQVVKILYVLGICKKTVALI